MKHRWIDLPIRNLPTAVWSALVDRDRVSRDAGATGGEWGGTLDRCFTGAEGVAQPDSVSARNIACVDRRAGSGSTPPR